MDKTSHREEDDSSLLKRGNHRSLKCHKMGEGERESERARERESERARERESERERERERKREKEDIV